MYKLVKSLLVLSLALCLFACDQRSDAQKIVDSAIDAHGGDAFENSQIEFDFRDKNSKIDTLTEERVGAFSRSVNSVAYFAFLPYSLNDAAAVKTYLGETEIKGKKYHQIKVTFEQQGGGDHYEDEFLYWFGKEDFLMDY